MEWSYVFTVVLTGMVVVFLGLVLLIAAITIMGKVFESIKASKKDTKPAPAAKPAKPAPAPAAVPVSTSADDDEVIAVIAAAVAAMAEADGTVYAIKSVKRSAPRRNAWGAAARSEMTSSF